MSDPFDQLRKRAACDGAYAAISFGTPQDREELGDVDALLEAWSRERHECIEVHLLLDRVGRFLTKILADETMTPSNRRQAGVLIRAIEASS